MANDTIGKQVTSTTSGDLLFVKEEEHHMSYSGILQRVYAMTQSTGKFTRRQERNCTDFVRRHLGLVTLTSPWTCAATQAAYTEAGPRHHN